MRDMGACFSHHDTPNIVISFEESFGMSFQAVLARALCRRVSFLDCLRRPPQRVRQLSEKWVCFAKLSTQCASRTPSPLSACRACINCDLMVPVSQRCRPRNFTRAWDQRATSRLILDQTAAR